MRERGAKRVFDIGNTIAAFSEEQAQRLTKLSIGRLRYWHKTGFFQPTFVEESQHLPFSRFYSFKDVVALRTLELLRVQNSVPLQHLRKVAEKLRHLRDDLWTNTTLFPFNKRVVFVHPETGNPEEILSGQYILGIPLSKVMGDTQGDIEKLRTRSKDELGHVTRQNGIARGASVIAGTRIAVVSVKRLHEDGYTAVQIMEEYPDLTEADIAAALAHEDKRAA